MHFYALNLDASGNRLTEGHRRYGLFYKVCTIGGRARLSWTQEEMPLHMAYAVREQLAAALADVDAYLASRET